MKAKLVRELKAAAEHFAPAYEGVYYSLGTFLGQTSIYVYYPHITGQHDDRECTVGIGHDFAAIRLLKNSELKNIWDFVSELEDAVPELELRFVELHLGIALYDVFKK